MNKRRIRRKFDQEFKMEAVRLVTEGRETVNDLINKASCKFVEQLLYSLGTTVTR